MPSGTSNLPTRIVERHLVLAVAGLLEPEHQHRQRLEHEAPDHAEGVGLAQGQTLPRLATIVKIWRPTTMLISR